MSRRGLEPEGCLSENLHFLGKMALGLLILMGLFEGSERNHEALLGRMLMGVALLSSALLLKQLRLSLTVAQPPWLQALQQAPKRYRWLKFLLCCVILSVVAEGVWLLREAVVEGDFFSLWDLLAWILLALSLLLKQCLPLRR